ncbi:probable protein phosphatase 2C 55 [Lycium ferocissimum]|uniref:probable protein phosphatase 2C 55 n=1 Tax=Lycium ferocissimum TaxID=112874 RepID=UPI0028156A54|nr:probable protein phosphatase 2C 55 [Lycium ferocissimum]
MAACISSLGHDQYSFNKFDEVIFKFSHKRPYFDFSSYEINDQLENHSNKRLKFSYDADQHLSFSINSSLGLIDQYSFKNVDEFFKINKRLDFSTSNKLPCLKMVAGSLYLPKENPKKPLGEDAHFIHELYQTVGIADGVGGWAKKKIDAGIYARELMKNSFMATYNEPKGDVNPKRVLQEAYRNTNCHGSSTACIITLNSEKNTLCAANVGDSGFFLIRKGKIIYKSPIQQRGRFGCPYQLGNSKDNPSVAQEMELNVEKDDILIVGTDGMLDNMNESEIEEIVLRGMDKKLKAEELASQIGNVALYNSFDRFADTPFARAAERERLSHLHKGGKIDDITVIVSYIQ